MRSGIGIRPELFEPVFDQRPEFGFLEAHSENYFGESASRAKLLELREYYPISLHGVGLSLGRADPLNKDHLHQLKQLVDEVEPMLVSEHLAWSAYSHRHVPDLLPLPLDKESFDIMCRHVDHMQHFLGRQILIENPSNYLLFDQLQIPEPEFLNALAEKTGCGLLVDINNIHVSATNLDRSGVEYLDGLNSKLVNQYHLAGYTEVQRAIGAVNETVLIDTHNKTVYEPVWELFEYALEQHGVRPTLFEWDSDFPDFSILVGECEKADILLSEYPEYQPGKLPSFPNEFKHHDDHLVADSTVNGLASKENHFLNQLFAQDARLDGATKHHQHRIWIYQNNVFGAIQDYMRSVFPATCGVVGDDFFKQMVQHFAQESPPIEGNIHNYGKAFTNVLGHFDGLSDLVYLRDLIEYEWALHSTYYCELGQVVNPGDVAQDELLVMPIVLNSSVTIIRSCFPLYEIHRQSLPDYNGNTMINLGQSQDIILVYKVGYQVRSKVLTQDAFLFIQEIRKKENLLQAIEGLQGSLTSESLSTCLSMVFEAQLLSVRQINNTNGQNQKSVELGTTMH